LKAHGIYVEDLAKQNLAALNPKDQKAVVRFVTTTIGTLLLSRIGPQGTMNLGYLWSRLQMGAEGSKNYVKYNENPIMDIIMHRPYPQKLVDKKLPYDQLQGLLQWLFKIEKPDEVEASKTAEEKRKKLFAKDVKTIGKNWKKVAGQ
jgi:hypothetical protein